MCMPSSQPGVRPFTECPVFCQITCGGNEMHCDGMIQPDGCRGPPSCVPLGEACPDSGLDPMGCPEIDRDLVCQEKEVLCNNDYDSMGCELPWTCIEECQGCPPPSHDPMGCPYPEMLECNPDYELNCDKGHDERV